MRIYMQTVKVNEYFILNWKKKNIHINPQNILSKIFELVQLVLQPVDDSNESEEESAEDARSDYSPKFTGRYAHYTLYYKTQVMSYVTLINVSR